MKDVKAGSYSLRTPENIELSFQLAGIGERILAFMIDAWLSLALANTLGLLILIIFLLAIIVFGRGLTQISSSLGTWLFAFIFLVNTVLNLGYFLYFEMRWQGQTPGKRWTGLRVLREDGRPLDFSGVLVRTLLRVVDQAFGLGLLVILCNDQEKRLGDWAAGTLVIKDKLSPNTKLVSKDAQPNRTPIVNIRRLKPQDYGYLNEFLQRRTQLELIARQELTLRLARRYSQILEEPLPIQVAEAEAFLERLYTEYGKN